MSKAYKVWTCKIIIDGDSGMPDGFDAPPRRAAQKAIEDAGLEVLVNSSGWGGSLDDHDVVALDEIESNREASDLHMRPAHDCEGCKPLGIFLDYDIYFCNEKPRGIVIERGEERNKYDSMLADREAVERISIMMAKAAGMKL